MQKALKLRADKNLSGRVETAMLFAIFDQSVMNLKKPISDNLADNAALRAMVTHTNDDKTHQFLSMEEGRKSLTKAEASA